MPLQKLAVLIPCHNEEPSIAAVVRDFKSHFPDADILVIDNASTDRTRAETEKTGVRLFSVPEIGKGNAVRKGFAEIDAEYYILVDGDGTYLAADALALYRRLLELQSGMVSGSRRQKNPQPGFNRVRALSNWAASLLFTVTLQSKVRDPLTGLRVISRDLLRRMEPLTSKGFEIETEIVVKALKSGLPVEEMPIEYLPRMEGSSSKLKVGRDAFRISKTLLANTFRSRH